MNTEERIKQITSLGIPVAVGGISDKPFRKILLGFLDDGPKEFAQCSGYVTRDDKLYEKFTEILDMEGIRLETMSGGRKRRINTENHLIESPDGEILYTFRLPSSEYLVGDI